jgi:hypothetical protein
MSVFLALRRLRQEDHEFKASLGYKVRSCFKKKPQTNKFPFRVKYILYAASHFVLLMKVSAY